MQSKQCRSRNVFLLDGNLFCSSWSNSLDLFQVLPLVLKPDLNCSCRHTNLWACLLSLLGGRHVCNVKQGLQDNKLICCCSGSFLDDSGIVSGTWFSGNSRSSNSSFTIRTKRIGMGFRRSKRRQWSTSTSIRRWRRRYYGRDWLVFPIRSW